MERADYWNFRMGFCSSLALPSRVSSRKKCFWVTDVFSGLSRNIDHLMAPILSQKSFDFWGVRYCTQKSLMSTCVGYPSNSLTGLLVDSTSGLFNKRLTIFWLAVIQDTEKKNPIQFNFQNCNPLTGVDHLDWNGNAVTQKASTVVRDNRFFGR